MQTFMPYADFKKSVQCLDYRRLGKQRVEAYQIHNIITKQTTKKGWLSHPAVLMWKDNPNSLAEYHNECVIEWIKRGYKNTMLLLYVKKEALPFWFGNEIFHASHRSNLLRKDYDYYKQYGWKEDNTLPYYWPITKETQHENL